MSSCFSPKNIVSKQHDVSLYDFVGDTLNSWSLVRKDSLWGYVSVDGKRAIKPTFRWATDFSDKMALAQDKRGYRYINREGKLLRRIKAQHAYSFAEGLAPVQIKGKWGYINNKGKKVIKPQFDWAQPFHENRATVSIGLRKGYINKDGQLIIPAVFEEARPFKNGVAIVRKDLQFGIIDTLGNFLLPNQYDEIERWESDFYRLGVYNPAADRVNTFGLADANGRLLLDTLYSAIDQIKDQYIRVNKDSLAGLFDQTGNVVIPMDYTFLGFISEEGLIAAKRNGRWGFLNNNGEVALPFLYEESKMGFSEGRTWVYKDNTHILMDNHFQVIKKFSEYHNVFYFSNGFAVVAKKDTTSYYDENIYGFIDRNGNEVIAPTYKSAWSFNPYGTTVVGIRTEEGVSVNGITDQFIIDTKGRILSQGVSLNSLEHFGNRLLYTGSSTFLSPKTGQPISDFPYEKLNPFEYGERLDLAKVYRDGKVGLIDTTLTELLPPEYSGIESIHNGRMVIQKEDLRGYADTHFRIRIPFRYHEADYFRYPITTVGQNKKKGVINRNGREVIPLCYDNIMFDYACDRIYAEKGDSTVIYDTEGRLLLATDFEYIGMYGRNNYVAFRQNGKLGFMDYNFQVLREPEFDGCGHFYDGLAWVALDHKGGYINKQFQLIIPIQFEYIENFAKGFAKVKKDGREYYIDTDGEEFSPTEIQLMERDRELERRKRGWIDFSS